ncbi:DUF732 domain-containing protein [Rhodococcus sp. 14-2470-1a]|uniref:DUF732 domain-containing protein n=1 Tax=Rhodococcus sp. 14-2470-1a TaxID=2023150 RepID=UPI000B9A5030|nr:DUF732 domain-containing protein [Rhodococcus sp. 14-2470-1a]OZF49134.1 DUF732 domain-containing protein [Rhodococcus sp. 14-2470-1a]
MRTSLSRTLSLAVLSVAAGGLLVACGSDDSTATGSPSTSSSTTTAAETTSAEATSSQETSSAAPTTSPGDAATAPPEQPQPVPEGFPGPTEAPVDARGQAFLDELEKQGVTVAGNGEIAISTASYICSAQSQGVPADEIATFVTANVGVEASAAGTQVSAEQAGETAQVYIASAQNTICKA